MIKKLRSFPLHVFLLPAFFILHVLNSYFGLIPGKAYATIGFYYFLLSTLLLLAGRFLLKSLSKAGIWTAGLLLVFYFFGSSHDWLKGLSLPGLFTAYSVLLTLFLIGSMVLFFYLKKHNGTFSKANEYLNLLFGILVLIEGVTIVYKTATGKQAENNYASTQTPVLNALPPQADQAPDIFFIVFDEYTSSLALKQYFRYDNSALDSSLLANHFFLAGKAQSNYNSTPLSIGSCFNMQYFNPSLEGDQVTTKKILQALYSLKKSQLPRLLSHKGYDIYNFGLCDLEHYPVYTSRTFARYETLPLYQETLWGRIERDIWWNTYKFGIPFLRKLRNNQFAGEGKNAIAINRTNFTATLAELKKQSSRPKFVFTHIMMPHAPFYLDENGQPYNSFSMAANAYDTALYLKQLAYSNKWIDSLAKAASQPFSRPRVVIIEGDHGFRDPAMAVREKQFRNLNAYYFSDKDYNALYDSISPINTFPVIFNKYFQTKLPLRKDSTFLLR